MYALFSTNHVNKFSAPEEIETESNDPYYLDIANQLREQLLSGKFKAGHRFYSIRGLIKDTGRSLPTVRSALSLLIEEGLLEARQGSGYYVTAKIEAAINTNKGFCNFLAVIPSSTEPDEPWFTGKIGLGMIQAANVDHAVISFYKRRAPGNLSPELFRLDLERIKALRPDGIAWLHNIVEDVGVLVELKKQGMPLVTTMRQIPGVELPLIQEDNLIYASMVLTNFEARGHQRIGIILRSLDDDYFRSKVEAFREVAPSFKVQAGAEDFFFLPQSDPTGEQQGPALQSFLESRPDLTGLLVMAATGIRPVVWLHQTAFAERMKKISIVLNVLDGVAVPTLPTGETLARIYPPLEKLGEHLVHCLTAVAGGRPLASLPRLIPVFQTGESLKAI